MSSPSGSAMPDGSGTSSERSVWTRRNATAGLPSQDTLFSLASPSMPPFEEWRRQLRDVSSGPYQTRSIDAYPGERPTSTQPSGANHPVQAPENLGPASRSRHPTPTIEAALPDVPEPSPQIGPWFRRNPLSELSAQMASRTPATRGRLAASEAGDPASPENHPYVPQSFGTYHDPVGSDIGVPTRTSRYNDEIMGARGRHAGDRMSRPATRANLSNYTDGSRPRFWISETATHFANPARQRRNAESLVLHDRDPQNLDPRLSGQVDLSDDEDEYRPWFVETGDEAMNDAAQSRPDSSEAVTDSATRARERRNAERLMFHNRDTQALNVRPGGQVDLSDDEDESRPNLQARRLHFDRNRFMEARDSVMNDAPQLRPGSSEAAMDFATQARQRRNAERLRSLDIDTQALNPPRGQVDLSNYEDASRPTLQAVRFRSDYLMDRDRSMGARYGPPVFPRDAVTNDYNAELRPTVHIDLRTRNRHAQAGSQRPPTDPLIFDHDTESRPNPVRRDYIDHIAPTNNMTGRLGTFPHGEHMHLSRPNLNEPDNQDLDMPALVPSAFSLGYRPSYRNPLPADYVSNLPRVPRCELTNGPDDLRCDICYENYDYVNAMCGIHLEEPVRLPCNHVFGHRCLQTWLRGGTTNAHILCPMCKAPLSAPVSYHPPSYLPPTLDEGEILQPNTTDPLTLQQPSTIPQMRTILTSHRDGLVQVRDQLRSHPFTRDRARQIEADLADFDNEYGDFLHPPAAPALPAPRAALDQRNRFVPAPPRPAGPAYVPPTLARTAYVPATPNPGPAPLNQRVSEGGPAQWRSMMEEEEGEAERD